VVVGSNLFWRHFVGPGPRGRGFQRKLLLRTSQSGEERVSLDVQTSYTARRLICGQGIANPIGQICPARLMMREISGRPAEDGGRGEHAIAAIRPNAKVRENAPDIGGRHQRKNFG